MERHAVVDNDHSPQLLGPNDVRAYLVFLVEDKRVSWSYCGQAICALRFLYRVTLGTDWVVKGVVRKRRPKEYPLIKSSRYDLRKRLIEKRVAA